MYRSRGNGYNMIWVVVLRGSALYTRVYIINVWVCECMCLCVFGTIRGIVNAGVAVNNTTRALIVTLKLKGIGRVATEIVDGEEMAVVSVREGVDVGPSVFCYKSLITFYYLSENFARRILNTF